MDVSDITSRAIATAIVTLHSSAFPREVQNTIENLSFDGSNPFSEKIEESLHSPKESRTTFCSMDIYTMALKSKHHKQIYKSRSPAQPFCHQHH